MDDYIKKYNEAVKFLKLDYVNKLKELYPTIYLLEVLTIHDYGKNTKIVACFTDENRIKNLIGTGNWQFYCGQGSESYHFKIIPMTNYDLDFNLLIHIDQIDMSFYGKMI
jgi:hypothetical protein